jgi:hypothetical protein
MQQAQRGHGAREIGIEGVFGELEGAEKEANGLQTQGGESSEVRDHGL